MYTEVLWLRDDGLGWGKLITQRGLWLGDGGLGATNEGEACPVIWVGEGLVFGVFR